MGYSIGGLLLTLIAVSIIAVQIRKSRMHRLSGTSLQAHGETSRKSETSPLIDSGTEKAVSVAITPAEEEAMALANVLDNIEGFTERLLRQILFRVGRFVGKHPFLTILLGIVMVAALSVGMIFFQVMNDPLNLWVSDSTYVEGVWRRNSGTPLVNMGLFLQVAEDSTGAQQMKYFNDHFGAFYRINQMIIYAGLDFISSFLV